MSKSESKVALVTGGGRGIGLGVSESLAREGYSLAICGVRGKENVTDAIELLEGLGAQVLYCQADISNAEARERMLAEIKERFGRLDVLVNNAGVAPAERLDILEATEESFERVVRINLQGPYFLTQAVARWMIEQRGEDAGFSGCIVNVSSVSAIVASTARGEYCVSKAGISMMTKLYAARLGEYNIPVYEIRPGIIKTDMTSGVQEKYDKLIGDGLLVQSRWGLPEDIGKCAASLARGDMAYSTGQVIMIDGGLCLERL